MTLANAVATGAHRRPLATALGGLTLLLGVAPEGASQPPAPLDPPAVSRGDSRAAAAVPSGGSPGSDSGAVPSPTAGPAGDPASPAPPPWGVQVLGVRTTAAGYLLDFRYRVLDPQRAHPLVDRQVRPYLEDAAGARLMVPVPPKVGALRHTPRDLQAGRSYGVLFANPGQRVRPGDRVTVVIGPFRAADLTVEG